MYANQVHKLTNPHGRDGGHGGSYWSSPVERHHAAGGSSIDSRDGCEPTKWEPDPPERLREVNEVLRARPPKFCSADLTRTSLPKGFEIANIFLTLALSARTPCVAKGGVVTNRVAEAGGSLACRS